MPPMPVTEKIKSVITLKDKDIENFNKHFKTSFEELKIKVSFSVHSLGQYSSVGNLRVSEIKKRLDKESIMNFLESPESVLGKGKNFKFLVDNSEDFVCKSVFDK